MTSLRTAALSRDESVLPVLTPATSTAPHPIGLENISLPVCHAGLLLNSFLGSIPVRINRRSLSLIGIVSFGERLSTPCRPEAVIVST